MELTPETKRLFTGTRAQFAWLKELGFEEGDRTAQRSGFHIVFQGARGRITVAVQLGGGGEVNTWLSPPGAPGRVLLRPLLKAHGLQSPPAGPFDNLSADAASEVLAAQSDALRLLGDCELAGDWSFFDRAVEITRESYGSP